MSRWYLLAQTGVFVSTNRAIARRTPADHGVAVLLGRRGGGRVAQSNCLFPGPHGRHWKRLDSSFFKRNAGTPDAKSNHIPFCRDAADLTVPSPPQRPCRKPSPMAGDNLQRHPAVHPLSLLLGQTVSTATSRHNAPSSVVRSLTHLAHQRCRLPGEPSRGNETVSALLSEQVENKTRP